MTLDDLKKIGNAASVNIAAGRDCTWTGNLLEPALWEALRIEMQHRFRRSTGETQAVLTFDISPTAPAPAELSVGSEALRLVIEYDTLLKKHQGDEDVILFDSDIVEVDDAYDRMVDAARAALAKPSEPGDHVVAGLPDVGDHINRLIVAIQPFVDFAQNVEYDEVLDASAWKSGIHRDAVSAWFGPSDFAYAAFAVSDTKSCIAALSSSEVEG